ncbi:MAG: hypothetical protein R6V58_11590 [Planctomycetota bacterium]
MAHADSRPPLAGCQVAVAVCAAWLALAAPAAGGEPGVRAALRRLRRLVATCETYSGPRLGPLLDRTMRAAVRLYEVDKYEDALNTILFVSALYPENASRAYYSFLPGIAELTLRWPGEAGAGKLDLPRDRYRWAMLAVRNRSGIELDLTALQAAVWLDGRALKDADGEPVASLPSDDPELARRLGARRRLVRPPKIQPDEAAAFVLVFPTFDEWTQLRLADQTEKIDFDAPIKNYAAMKRHHARLMAARRRVAALRREQETNRPDEEPAEKDDGRYVRVGTIHGPISAGPDERVYNIAVERERRRLVRKHDVLYVRKGGVTRATLTPTVPGRTIARLDDPAYRPRRGDEVYVRNEPADREQEP